MSRQRRRPVYYSRQRFPKMMQKKLVKLFIAIILAFVCLMVGIVIINAFKGEEYTKVVLDQQKYDSRIIPFKRGDIIDRNGTKLAASERVYNVVLDAKVLLSEKDKDRLNQRLKETKMALLECFGIENEAVDNILAENPEGRYNVMLRRASYEQGQAFKKMRAETVVDEKTGKEKLKYPYISGVWLEEDYFRKYPYQTLAADVIGFTVSGNVGSIGLEASYNNVLNGTDGRGYGYQDLDASLKRDIKPPMNGNNVVSTIDIMLQSIVEKHIREFNEAHRGEEVPDMDGSLNTAVIIANPNTGEILAEASYPTFDLNNPRDLSAYYSEEEWESMEEDERLSSMNALWSNFCVTTIFEPGSVIKPFTVATGLETGKLTGSEVYNCTGSLSIPNVSKPIKCHKLEGHGMQTVGDAIANSCNVALMHMGETIGAEDFLKYQKIFGFEKKTGIELPWEAEGVLFHQEEMKPIDLATSSFGQNFTVTATQMVAGFSSLINGGNYYKPYIVKQIQDENGNVIENKEPVLLRKTVSKETSDMMKSYMRQTMITGTGKTAQVEGYDIGAKTGTSEKQPRGSGKHLLSYMGFAPVDSPEVVIYVIVDEPNVKNQAFSKYVLELSKAIMEEAFPYLNITKSAVPEQDTQTGEEAAQQAQPSEGAAQEGQPSEEAAQQP